MLRSTLMASAAALVVVLASSGSFVEGVKVAKDLSQKTLAEEKLINPLPPGDYTNSCQQCSINSQSLLSCTCFDATGAPQSTSIQNAWSCQFCLTNNNGQLACTLPASSDSNGYAASCAGCGVSYDTLFCNNCQGQSYPIMLQNACSSCDTVSYISGTQGSGLVCNAPTTDAPTESPTPRESTPEPTEMPTQKPVTNSPTPNAAPPQCESFWLNINGNGVEAAPWRSCDNFTARQGCQQQNWCCWQQTSTTEGVCRVPNGVTPNAPDTECTNYTSQSSCNQFSPFCTWDSTWQPSGLCRRVCPGNPATMCVF